MRIPVAQTVVGFDMLAVFLLADSTSMRLLVGRKTGFPSGL